MTKTEKEDRVEKIKVDEVAELNIPFWKANFWFVVLWLIMICDYMDRMAINAVLPLLKAEFGFTDAQSGLISSVLSITMLLLAPVVAMWADQWSRRKLIAGMVAIWSLATYLTGKASSYYALLTARLVVGAGEAGYNSSGSALVSVWYPKKIRGTMMGLFFSGQVLGSALGVIVAGAIAHAYGWRTCFGILAVPGFFLAVLAWFLPDYKAERIQQEKTVGKKGGILKALKETLTFIVKSPSLFFVYLTVMAVTFYLLAFTVWGVTVFVRSFDMNVKQASLIVGPIGLIGFLGAPFAGWVADKAVKRAKKGRVIAIASMMCIAGIVSTALLLITIPAKNLPLTIALWTVGSFFTAGLIPVTYAIVQDIVPASLRTSAAGMILLFGGVGSFSGPPVCGFFSDRMGLIMALQTVVVVSVVWVVISSFLASKFYDRDIERAKAFGSFEIRKQ